MDVRKSNGSVSKIILASVAALLIIGVTVTTIMLKAKKQDQPIIEPEKDNSSTPDISAPDNKEKATAKAATVKTEAKENSSQNSTEFPIDVNKATVAQLCSIDGVGDYLAKNIIAYREKAGVITSLDMLINADGIGKKTLEKLKPYLYVSDSDKAVSAAVSVTTSTATSKTKTATIKKTSEAEKTPTAVNINTATAEQIADSLLLSLEDAEKIITLRNTIKKFSAKEEILYSGAVSENQFNRLKDYILI